MTIQELQQLFYLNGMIRVEEQRLESLWEAASIKSPSFTDQPKAPGAQDKIGDLVPQIVDQEAAVIEARDAYIAERDRLLDYIRHVPHMRIRLILTLRFIDQKSWQEVADIIGGKETEYSVKQACYRYIEQSEEPAWMKDQITMFDEEGE